MVNGLQLLQDRRHLRQLGKPLDPLLDRVVCEDVEPVAVASCSSPLDGGARRRSVHWLRRPFVPACAPVASWSSLSSIEVSLASLLCPSPPGVPGRQFRSGPGPPTSAQGRPVDCRRRRRLRYHPTGNSARGSRRVKRRRCVDDCIRRGPAPAAGPHGVSPTRRFCVVIVCHADRPERVPAAHAAGAGGRKRRAAGRSCPPRPRGAGGGWGGGHTAKEVEHGES